MHPALHLSHDAGMAGPRTILSFAAVLSLPLLVSAQSALDFPRSIQPSDFSTSGFAIVNPGPTPALVTFTLYKADGAVEKSSTETIPARGQLARSAGELFGGAVNAGWVQASSGVTGLQGFWLGGDYSTFMDGAEAAPSSANLVLPLVSPQSEIHVANTGFDAVTVVFEVYGDDGFLLPQSREFPQYIPPKGFFKREASEIFPGVNLNPGRHVRLRCANPFAAVVIARNYLNTGPSWAVANAVPAFSSSTEMNFPQVVDGAFGGANWISVLGVSNLSATSSNDLFMTFTRDDGTPLQTVQRTLPPNGALRDTARGLFSLPAGFQNGSVRVAGSLPLAGYVAYADTVGTGVAVVPPQQQAQSNLLFAHIADLPPWWTGLALLNTNAAAANVEIFALAPGGTLIGSARLALGAGQKVSKLLSELIPQTQRRTSDGGFVFVRSDVPVYGIELFFARDLKVLANVAAGRLAPGITYTPPSP